MHHRLYIKCMQCRRPTFDCQRRCATSPPDPCLPKSVCNVATRPYLKIVESGLGFILLWSIKCCVSSCKKTDTKIIMEFFQNYHKVKHTCICNVAMDHPQLQTYMQCRPLNLALQKVYARSPLFIFLMEGDMQCRHVTPVISINHNQIPLRCHRNPRIAMDCLIFCMQCRHAIPLANWAVYAVSPWGWPNKWYAVSPCDLVCQQYTLCNVAPHPFTVMHICNVAA